VSANPGLNADEKACVRLAEQLACPTSWIPPHDGSGVSGDLVLVPGIQYARVLRCQVCGFEFRVTGAQARRAVKALGGTAR
jgi:hypothetical protein